MTEYRTLRSLLVEAEEIFKALGETHGEDDNAWEADPRSGQWFDLVELIRARVVDECGDDFFNFTPEMSDIELEELLGHFG